MVVHYKIRKIVAGNKSGDCYGVTLNTEVLKQFQRETRAIHVEQQFSGGAIILTPSQYIIPKRVEYDEAN